MLRVYAVDNGEQTQVASVTLGADLTSIYLQMVKRGKIYSFNYSLDGENWTKFGSITMTGTKSPASFSERTLTMWTGTMS